MKSFLFFVFLFLGASLAGASGLIQGSLQGNSGGQGNGKSSSHHTFVITPSVTYERANFNYSIGYPSQTPNIVSFLDSENLSVYKGNLELRGNFGDFVVKGDIAYGHIGSGSFLDSDYAGDNKTKLYSYSKSKITGSLYEGKLGVGHRLSLGSFNMTPLLGMLYQETRYTMKDMNQITSDATNLAAYNALVGSHLTLPAAGSSTAGKVATYTTKIYGPWVGSDLRFELNQFHLMAHLNVGYMTYRGNGNWLLRNYRFKDSSSGLRFEGQLGAIYKMTESFHLNMAIGGTHFKIKQGDTTTSSGTIKNYFKGGLYKSWSFSLGGKLQF